MKLRTIILILSFLGLCTITIGGFLFYSTLKESAFEEADLKSTARLDMITKYISAYLSENIKTVRTLAGMEVFTEMLVRPNETARNNANTILDLYRAALEVDVCYLMNSEGTTVASSNRNAPDSFLGKNFAFRPYFQQAIHSMPATYLALGATSKKRGVYYSFPIFEKGVDIPIGLIVIKASIELIENKITLFPDEIVLVTDPRGVIFISSRKEWRYQSIVELSPQEKELIRKSRQFGDGPWDWIGLKIDNKGFATEESGSKYLLHKQVLENFPGWNVYHLENYDSILKRYQIL